MIVLDFDGTLVDVWRRYHIVFCDGLEDSSSAPTLDEFKALKRQLVRDGTIAQSISIRLASDYFRTKKRKLESEDYLALDTSLLTEESSSIIRNNQLDFVILSARRSRELLLWEIDRLGIPILPRQVFVVDSDYKDSKARWLIGHKELVGYIVGDSKAELHGAPEVVARRIFVDTGLFSFVDIETDNGLDIQYCSSINDFLKSIVVSYENDMHSCQSETSIHKAD